MNNTRVGWFVVIVGFVGLMGIHLGMIGALCFILALFIYVGAVVEPYENQRREIY